MRSFKRISGIGCVCLVWLMASADLAGATTRLKDICRVKGQEENVLQGMGLVVGLKGTGDGGQFLPTMRLVASALQVTGNPVGGPLELKDAKNVAIVLVTARIPAAGAREGTQIDCTVSSWGSAKSLAGGVLFMTPMQGPMVEQSTIYAFAEGPLHVEDVNVPTTAKVFRGCRLEEDFLNPFMLNGKVTLVLDANHADFEGAFTVADSVNQQLGSRALDGDVRRSAFDEPLEQYGPMAMAIDQQNIEVRVPEVYLDDPVDFVAQVLGLEIIMWDNEARVVINERTGGIVIDGNVEIGASVVSHANVVVETGGPGNEESFFEFSPGDQTNTTKTKLQSLVETLEAVKVSQTDIIDIIKGLDRMGKLHGRLIIE